MKSLSFLLIIILSMIVSSCNKTDTSSGPSSTLNPNSGNPANCIAVDTDGDGLIDCLDPDIDGDSFLNEIDSFPYDKTEWKDTDGDRVGDNSDAFPLDSTEWKDTDGDGIGDNTDEDIDNDGVPNLWESIPFDVDVTEYFDADHDGLGDNIDEDRDNDGVPNLWDKQFWNANVYFDIDNDGADNSSDSDIDGDNYPNIIDSFPYNNLEWLDTDHDGIGNNSDPDDDNDGFPDSWEDFPIDTAYMFDTDDDGFSNELDAFPYDKTEWIDTDGDGVGDNSDAFPLDPSAQYDTDRDGIPDNIDPDADNDGRTNCVPIDLATIASCNKDAFPSDPTEWIDTDADGIGNNIDEDDDNDGIPDLWDYYSLDKLYFTDEDGDGIPDGQFPETPAQAATLPAGAVWFTIDEDIDNDGVPNLWDAFPHNINEWSDIDLDRTGDSQDLDKDGDTVSDVIDRFPYDPSEWADSDNDGLGNNIDEDDDNDGVPDLWDELPLNKNGFSDLNKDGIPDQISFDIDGDTFPNGGYSCSLSAFKHLNTTIITYTALARVNKFNSADYTYDQNCSYPANDPLYKCEMINDIRNLVCEYPEYHEDGSGERKDLFMWDSSEWKDNDKDGLPDNGDEDSDNDGVPNLWDRYSNDNVVSQNYSWADNDGNGQPDSSYVYDAPTTIWIDIFATDIDGDSVIQGPFNCINNMGTMTCGFQKTRCENVQNPSYGIGGNPATINICFEYDAFPYSASEQYDTDGDRLGDNKDLDIDGDGKTNCSPVDLNTAALCNQDQLPEVGQFDPFVTSTYKVYSGVSVIQEIPYCSNQTNCYYINYDRDSDGLTDYQEYLNQTNPLAADTDGDGVPDGVEVTQGTSPIKSISFLDTDGDIVPDYLDKTPLGAHDETSLIDQIASASTCKDKVDEISCNANVFGLCSWNAGSSTCNSNDILVTKNIDLKHCINIDGTVSIRGAKKYDLKIHSDIQNDSTNCDLLNIIPITGTINSKITLKNLSLISDSGYSSNFINSSGSFLRLDDIAIYMIGQKFPMAVKYSNTIAGNYQQYKTSTNLVLDYNQASVNPFPDKGFNIVAKTINLDSNVINCDAGTGTSAMTGFDCVNTTAETASFNYNFISIDSGLTLSNLNYFALNHMGTISTSLTGKNYFSSAYRSLKISGVNPTYLAANIFTFDRNNVANPARVCINCSSTDNIITSLGFNVDNNAFSLTDPSRLYCASTIQGTATTQSINFLYLDPAPAIPSLTSQNLQIFNSSSFEYVKNGSTYNGNFNFETDLTDITNGWTPFKTPDLSSVFPSAPVTYNSILNNILLVSNSTGYGLIGHYYTLNANLTKKYKLKFKPTSAIVDSTDIVLDVNIFDKSTSQAISNSKIRLKPEGSQLSSLTNTETGITDYYINYTGDVVEIVFQPTQSNNVGIKISNTVNNISKDVYIDDISITEGVVYPIQFAGSSKLICE